MLDWITCLHTFQVIVQSNSFTKAAKRLYTSPSAVSKRIQWLEDTLSVPLFHRSTRKLCLTEGGQALYERSLPLLNEWQEIKQAISTQHLHPTGILRLGVPIGFGSCYIIDMLPNFLNQYPEIQVDLRLTNCISQLANQHIDIFICYDFVLQNKENFLHQPIMDTYHQMFASPGYIAKHGKPKTLEDVAKYDCLLIDCERDGTHWEFEAGSVSVSGKLRTNNTTAAVNAAKAGLGILSIFPSAISKEIANGSLVPLLPKHKTRTKTLNAYYPKQEFIPKKTLAFLEQMKQYFCEKCAI